MRGESEQKAAKGSGGLNFQTVHRAWESRALWVAPARHDRWIKNNGNAESSVARLLLRRLFSIAENNKKKEKKNALIEPPAAAGDDTRMSSTRQTRSEGLPGIIEHRFPRFIRFRDELRARVFKN